MKTTIPLFLAFLYLSAAGFKAQAVSPPPDGGYPGGNTAEGQNALFAFTAGGFNTAVGFFSLAGMAAGNFNTAVGAGTLALNNADRNTATGTGALLRNSGGGQNTANGAFALLLNTIGGFNTAVGDNALSANIVGFDNTATGAGALVANTSGEANTADGRETLAHNTTGSDNTALGYQAGFNATTGDGNVYVGAGMQGVANEADHTYIRNINTTSVSGGGTDAVTVDLTTGLLGHAASSRRYKEDIRPMENASQALFRLKPVSFRYKKEIDRSQSLDYGLIAEEVGQVDSALAIRDKNGQIESVRYTAINAMLLNEFLKEHRTVEALQASFAQQQKDFQAIVTHQQKQIEALTAGLQKVSAQLSAASPSLADLNQANSQ
jgi:hypothetical protein